MLLISSSQVLQNLQVCKATGDTTQATEMFNVYLTPNERILSFGDVIIANKPSRRTLTLLDVFLIG